MERNKINTAKDRVKEERNALEEKITKLENLLGKVRSENWEAHKNF